MVNDTLGFWDIIIDTIIPLMTTLAIIGSGHRRVT